MPATSFSTPFGACGIAWVADEITAFELPPTEFPIRRTPFWVASIVARVQRHLAGELQDFSNLPYAWENVSVFQRRVYEAALQVKAGETWSYGQLAASISESSVAARAVGTALGQNPWPLLVPCHRFIGADGGMTGFSAPGGIKTKLRLLALEGVELFAE